jgi:hypothetical protein
MPHLQGIWATRNEGFPGSIPGVGFETPSKPAVSAFARGGSKDHAPLSGASGFLPGGCELSLAGSE